MTRNKLAAAMAAAIAVVATPSAFAGQAIHDRIHEEGGDQIADFCGAGFAVDRTFSIDLRVVIVPRGPERLEYFLQQGVLAETFTNRGTGKTVSAVFTVLERDHTITENGDGSLTIVVLATGNATVYGPDGKAIARNPGQVRFILYVAADGTLTRGAVVKGSTGRSDDICAASIAALR